MKKSALVSFSCDFQLPPKKMEFRQLQCLRVVHSHILNVHTAHGPSIARLQMGKQTSAATRLDHGGQSLMKCDVCFANKMFWSSFCVSKI